MFCCVTFWLLLQSTRESYPLYPWGYDSRVLQILTGTEDMTHGYCISSRVLRIWLTSTAYPHGYWGYDSRVLRIWLTDTAYPHGYWGYDSRVLRIWLTDTACPHGYWGYDSRVLHILMGTEDMTHGYWWYDSRVMHILTGTAYSLYRVNLFLQNSWQIIFLGDFGHWYVQQIHTLFSLVAEALTGLIYHRPSGENSNVQFSSALNSFYKVLTVEHASPDHSTQVFIIRHNGIRQIKQGWI